jgi:DNA mismatch repair protein MutL
MNDESNIRTNRSIERLERDVASRIAAGEVIERPVSAVKELLENSIDAGASDIRISLEQGGKASCVVEDNGCGIPCEELPLAVERYATSKIRSLDDMERVHTLGYRGEALSSIATVSRVELRSMPKDSASGGMLRCEGGVIAAHVEMPVSPGTRVQVDDLFYNLPARRKFLKSATTELKRIIQVVQDYALVYPNIRFRVSNDGKTLLDIGEASSTDEALAVLWGEGIRSAKTALRRDSAAVSLWWNSLPGSRRVNVTAFVNRRRVQDVTIRSALNSTDGSIYGEWIVMVDLPPEDVDVNIHPAKAEVRFRKSGPIFELVRKGAQELLIANGGFSTPSGTAGQTSPDPWENYVPPVEPIRSVNYGNPSYSASPSASLAVRGESEVASPRNTHLFDNKEPTRKYLGQTQGGYLVFDDMRGLCLLDAHAAHERILYEQIEDSYADKNIPSQNLLFEQEVPPAVIPGVIMHRDELAVMGFVFKLEGDEGHEHGASMMTAVPSVRGLAKLSPIEMLRSALRGLEEEEDPSKRDREVWWRWARTACRDAVKLGDEIEREEAMRLFERLERCRFPYSCPHGRPTTIFLAGDKLKSWFER